MRVPLLVEPIALPAGITVLQLSGELYAEHPAPQWLGDVVPVAVSLLEGRSRPADIACSLSDQQILALEQTRGDQELQIRINLTGVLPQGPGEFPFAHDQEILRVPTSRWGQQLESLGRAVSITIAVPLPPDGAHLADAGNYLREAKLLITDGKYEPAVVKVRHALERMQELKHWPTKPPKDQPDPTKWSQDVRWGVILRSLWAQACGAAHADEVTKDFVYTRSDAISLQVGAAGILNQLTAVLAP
ncbi:hypothetical protein CLV71_114111 [Actinophytocola oryzae]|uniref:Uncharacterized protein n=2 Tax=Actinophytocola oryzae TaxID=502181 RepID=A0A4R7V617_9PSEU|nr:hypothetical protein CLV71_114111 [Actinophytocola oryzae]